jgi:hypothetical protein
VVDPQVAGLTVRPGKVGRERTAVKHHHLLLRRKVAKSGFFAAAVLLTGGVAPP